MWPVKNGGWWKFTNTSTSRHIIISHFNFYFVFISGSHLSKVKFSVPSALMTSPASVVIIHEFHSVTAS